MNVPVKHLAWEFLEGTIHYDTKVWRTLKYLLLRPGLLTEKFNLGQRASYVPPFRLYVFVSIVFFFVLALRAGQDNDNVQVKIAEEKAAAALTDSLLNANKAFVLPADSAAVGLPALPLEERSEMWEEFMTKFRKFTQDEADSTQKLLKNTSFMMFLLMPFFGLILHLFYYKQRRNYVEHLMFSIHFHTFFFILVILALGVEFVFEGFDVDTWVFWIAVVYLFLALHRVYKQSYLRTFVMLLPVGIVYLIALTLLFLGTLAVSVMMS